jgi:hypothetical protein
MVHFGGWCRKIIFLGNGLYSHSLWKIHYIQVSLCLVSEEWTRSVNGSGSTIKDKISLGKTHSLQVAPCLVSDEWTRIGNGPGSKIEIVILPCLRRIVQITHH